MKLRHYHPEMRPTANWPSAEGPPRGFLQLTPPFVMIARNVRDWASNQSGNRSNGRSSRL